MPEIIQDFPVYFPTTMDQSSSTIEKATGLQGRLAVKNLLDCRIAHTSMEQSSDTPCPINNEQKRSCC